LGYIVEGIAHARWLNIS